MQENFLPAHAAGYLKLFVATIPHMSPVETYGEDFPDVVQISSRKWPVSNVSSHYTISAPTARVCNTGLVSQKENEKGGNLKVTKSEMPVSLVSSPSQRHCPRCLEHRSHVKVKERCKALHHDVRLVPGVAGFQPQKHTAKSVQKLVHACVSWVLLLHFFPIPFDFISS